MTQILGRLRVGDPQAIDQLFPLLYERLQGMAQRRMQAEHAGHTLDSTALVHEVYVKLVGQSRTDWKNRAHFLSVAAMAMRRILVNHAEKKRADKRGGGQILATFHEELVSEGMRSDDLLALDESLERLSAMSARQAKVVEYRFFGGLSYEETAEVLGVSVPTVRRDWKVARAWLIKELKT